MKSYSPRDIEPKWQKIWADTNLYAAVDGDKTRPKYYMLTEFPYPSGDGLHAGHAREYTVGDVIARSKRMQGHNVLYPMGWDAFGLPTENFAIKHKIMPQVATATNVATFRKQMDSLGLSFDWNREINTTDPNYYRWTQWLFLQFLKHGLAYQDEIAINWCPKEKTGLANEEVVNGLHERCGTPVEKKLLKQWLLKITAYADRLVDGLKTIDFPPRIADQQINWIGRSEGAEIDFGVGGASKVKRFVLLHGRNSGPNQQFFPWLKSELEQRGFQVQVPQLPSASEPNDEQQADYAEKHCTLDKNTIVLGHSMGGIVALRLLERGHKVHQVILASTPFSGRFNDGKQRPTVTDAAKKGFNFDLIHKNSDEFLVLRDTTDDIIPNDDADQFAKHLSAPLVEVEGTEPHFYGSEEPAILRAALRASGETVTVYTTRPDTLAGATFLVLAPEHPAVAKITTPAQASAVEEYVQQAQRETDLQRQEEERPKTGVFTRAYTQNPITHEPMPIWIADYVLAGYGTGAIMAVPAHDERDFAFARAMNQRMQPSETPEFIDETSLPHAGEPLHNRVVAQALVQHPTENKFLLQRKLAWETESYSLPIGGQHPGESAVTTALRELREETGYHDIASAAELAGPHYVQFYHEQKKLNRRSHVTTVAVKLRSLNQLPISPEEKKLHDLMWVSPEEAITKVQGEGCKRIIRNFIDGRTSELLRIIPVVEPVTGLVPKAKETEKQAIVAVVRDPKAGKVLMLDWGPRQADWGGMLFIGGGVEPGETDLMAAAKREIAEETGYTDVELVRQSPVQVHNHYFSNPKRRYDFAHITPMLFELKSDKQVPTKLDDNEKGLFKPKWVNEAEVLSTVNDGGHELVYRLLHDDHLYTGEGPLINSGQFNGLAGTEAKHAITEWLYEAGIGRHATKYRLRDWIFSRQHYWGEPIPVIHCSTDGVVPVPEDQLPVVLPEVKSYEPTDTGESPLAAISDWVNTTCPRCGGPAKRETDTMPNWAGSSWYWLRYMDPHNDQAFADPEKLAYWGAVDLYLGGMEHTTLHLLYSRFWHQFLYDQKLVPTPEPYAARRGQGIVLAADGRKMSKSIGNVINPTDVIARYGADAFRLYIMFMAPYDEATPWSDERLNGVSRFLYRVWAVASELMANNAPTVGSGENGAGELAVSVDRVTHKTLKKVHDDLADMRFNTMVSTLMEYVNFLNQPKIKSALTQAENSDLAQRTVRTLTLMLAPAAPHIAEELWRELGEQGSVHVAAWPTYDPEALKDDIITIMVQVAGKVRGQILAAPDTPEAELINLATTDPKVAAYLQGATITKTVVVPRKLVNFVVK